VPTAKAVDTFELPEGLQENEDVSGIALRGDLMLLAVDEGREIQVLEQKRQRVYEVVETEELLQWPEDKELDLEGLARTERYVYAIGSHSQKRKSVDANPADGKEAKKNRKRLFETAVEPSREYMFRFEVEDDGKIKKSKIKLVTLRDLFATHPILRRFQVIPSKENGIDIEGIAAGEEDQVYLGFRGPVLRGGYALILIVKLKEDDGELEIKHDVKDDIRFVHLGGRGVRDMVRISEPGEEPRLLILAGPMGDGPASYQVYEWDGQHTVPGTDKPNEQNHAKLQCEIPRPDGEPGAKAEGIALIEASADTLKFVVVYDSAKLGAPTVFSCPRTPPSGSS
jgi:hypothetical protein